MVQCPWCGSGFHPGGTPGMKSTVVVRGATPLTAAEALVEQPFSFRVLWSMIGLLVHENERLSERLAALEEDQKRAAA